MIKSSIETIELGRCLPALVLGAIVLAFPATIVAVTRPHQAPPDRAGNPLDPYAKLSPSEAMAMRWEEEAARRGGRFVCANPAHHHRMSPQMHWLIEDDSSGGDANPIAP